MVAAKPLASSARDSVSFSEPSALPLLAPEGALWSKGTMRLLLSSRQPESLRSLRVAGWHGGGLRSVSRGRLGCVSGVPLRASPRWTVVMRGEVRLTVVDGRTGRGRADADQAQRGVAEC